MIYNLDKYDDSGKWETFEKYPPVCKECGGNNTRCADFWVKQWQCKDCYHIWHFQTLAIPPYYDPDFPYPEIQLGVNSNEPTQ